MYESFASEYDIDMTVEMSVAIFLPRVTSFINGVYI